jgi:hypothetical protein
VEGVRQNHDRSRFYAGLRLYHSIQLPERHNLSAMLADRGDRTA